MDKFDTLIEIAIGLNKAVNSKDRYGHFLGAIRKVIPCDAASIMLIDGEHFKLVASFGLSEKAKEKDYLIREEPRLKVICESIDPVIFPSDSRLKDPFDNLLGEDEGSPGHVHSCMGCPLTIKNKLVGIFTADAMEPGAFDHMDHKFLKLIGELAGSSLNISSMMDQLEEQNVKQKNLSNELLRVAGERAGELLGNSVVMKDLREEIKSVAQSEYSVLINGESGVGKELVARMIHKNSRRKKEPLIYINCAALTETLAESELFGHVKGAFTGANKDRAGKFEVADGGTLFLDEVGELALSVQAKLLRAIQEGEIQKVGSDKVKKVNVRLLAATNRELDKECDKGNFRLDLYHRLNVVPILVPALREHSEDIDILVNDFVEEDIKKLGLDSVTVDKDTVSFLKTLEWPGNIRELKNLISRTLIRAKKINNTVHLSPDLFDKSIIIKKTTSIESEKSSDSILPLRTLVEEFQRETILRAVKKNKGNWSRASSLLGMNRSNLFNLAKRLGIK